MTTVWSDVLANALPPTGAEMRKKGNQEIRESLGSSVPHSLGSLPDDRLTAPTTRAELQRWCKQWLDVALPGEPVCECHNTPLDYLEYVFFEKGDADPLVWACRGGGKTLLGAVATLLDMLFKPGVEIRILGGSQTQSERMYEHLVRMVERHFRDRMIRG